MLNTIDMGIIFDYLPYILTGICVIMLMIIIGSIIGLIIVGKKKKKMQNGEAVSENTEG